MLYCIIIVMNKLLSIFKTNLYAASLYVRRIAGAFCVFFIARYLSVYDYGIYSSYIAIAGYLLLFANLGFNEYILVSTNNETKRVKIKQSFFILFAILLSILYSVISRGLPIEKHLIFILIIFKCFFDGTFFALVLPYFQSSKKFYEIGMINIIYSILIILIAICALLFKLSLIKYLLLCIILGIINFIQCSFYIKINYLQILKKFKDVGAIIDKSILQYMFVTILFVTREQLPSLFVATTVQKETAALYFAALAIATVPSLCAAAQLQQIMPEMINRPKEHIISVMKKASLLIFYINAGVIVFLAIFGKMLLQLLYGKEYYSKAYGILLFLAFITTLSGVVGPLGTYITASGNQKFKLRCQIEMIVIALISMAVLYRFGIYAILCMFLIVSLYAVPRYWIFVKKHLENIN